MAYETEIINGNKCVVRHLFKAREIKVGSRWQPADGAEVIYTVERINQYGADWYEVVYSYEKNGQKFTYEKDVFNFQCHQCLIID